MRKPILLALVLTGVVAAQPAQDAFSPLAFLVGAWTGEGDGGPGQGAGEFSFRADLQGKVLVRKNFAEYPAQNGNAAFRHDDLMIVYAEAGKLRAIYFDSENHVIRYAVETSADTVRFLSEPSADQSRYRLTYRKTGDATAELDFEIAPPGKPDAFKNYIHAKLRRK